jgi:hypothetical protein
MINSATMRNFPCIVPIFFAVCCATIHAASPRYLGDVDLGFPGESRTSLTFGDARAVLLKDGRVQFQGHGDAGRPWRAVLQTTGNTTVWKGDFDHDFRPDLLVASEVSQVGHCIDKVVLSFLLFEQHGEPVPWIVSGLTPWYRRFQRPPAVFRTLNGGTELVLSDCDWINNHSGGEDRSITGIYRAKDAMWRLVRPDNLAPYARLVRRSYELNKRDRLLPSQPASWTDQGNSFDETQPQTTISAVLPASPNCRGIRLPIGPDGRVFIDPDDPCKELGKDRIEFSDGRTCYGWPTVMLDRANGREIVAESETKDLEPLLREIAAKQYPVTLAGQKEVDKCSPSLLWARERN